VDQTLRDHAELMRRVHYAVATSEDRNISNGDSLVYLASRGAFTAAVVAAYPDLPTAEIMDVWLDCNESVAYCANYVRQQLRRERGEVDDQGRDI